MHRWCQKAKLSSKRERDMHDGKDNGRGDRPLARQTRQTNTLGNLFLLSSLTRFHLCRPSVNQVSSWCRRLIDPMSHQGPWLLHHYHLDVFFGTPPLPNPSFSQQNLVDTRVAVLQIPADFDVPLSPQSSPRFLPRFAFSSRHSLAILLRSSSGRAPLNCSAQFRHGLTRVGLHFISSRRRRRNIN